MRTVPLRLYLALAQAQALAVAQQAPQLLLAASPDSWAATRYEVVAAAPGEAAGAGARCATPAAWDGNLPETVAAGDVAARAALGRVDVEALPGARRFDFGGGDAYELLERDYNVVGDRLWESSLVLALYLRAKASVAPDGSVLELGAGLGLPSVDVSRRLPRATVTATDALPDVVDHLRLNADRAGASGLRAATLDYAERPAPGAAPDVVLGADIAYLADHAQALARYLARLRPKLGLIVAPTTRSTLYDLAAALLADGADVSEERYDLLSSASGATGAENETRHAAHYRVLSVRYRS